MSEKYFVVSESELSNLRGVAYCAGYYDTGEQDDPDAVGKAEAACRAKEVFWFDVGKAWVEVDK